MSEDGFMAFLEGRNEKSKMKSEKCKMDSQTNYIKSPVHL